MEHLVRRFMLAQESVAQINSTMMASRGRAVQACVKLHSLFSRALTLRGQLVRVPELDDVHPAGILHTETVCRRALPSLQSSSRVLQDHNRMPSSPPGKPEHGAQLIQSVAAIVHSRLRRLLHSLYTYTSIQSTRHGNILAFSTFLRRELHVSSTKDAFHMIASSSHMSTRVPFEIPSTHFIKGLSDLGFSGDIILLASTLDPDRKGIISITSFTRALLNAQIWS